MSKARRYGHPLSVLGMDLDGLEILNAGYGHQAGDAILKTLARRIFSNCRASDMVARYGGEESA
jgi:diguanylate cyclase (GGDEF)-like protein